MKPTPRTVPFLLLLLCSFLTGCVQSLHPFVKESQVTFDPKLVGTWTDADGKNRFDVAADDANRGYTVTTTDDDGKIGHFHVLLATVGGRLLIDISPADRDDPRESGAYKGHFVPLHSFMLVDRTPPTLRLTPMDHDWFKQYLADHPTEIAHVPDSPDRPILTAPTDDLQAFLLKHLKTPGAYGDPIELKRAPTTQPTTK